MALPDLTGIDIEQSYQRVLHTDGTNIYDGTGSLFTVTAVAAPAGPYQSIQFNDEGATSGSANFIFNKTTNAVSLTGSLYLAGTTPSIYFSGSGAASRLVWNDTDGTLDLGLKGGNVTLQIGQEQVIQVINKTGANLLESQYRAVRIRRVDEGGAQGQRLAIVLAQADSDTNSVDTLGLVTENIDVNQEGFITNSGLVRNIDTTGTLQGETWVDGDVLYLSPATAGRLTKVKPQAPQHTVIMGYVVYAHNNNGKIFVKVDNGYELDELHNVKITTASLATGDLLSYSSSVWINTKQLTGSYGLTGSLTFTSGGLTGSLFGTASWAYSASQAISSSYALTSSFITASNVYGPYGSNSVLSSSYAESASYTLSSSYSLSSSYVESSSYSLSGSYALTASYALNVVPIDTGSLVTTASVASNIITFTKGDGSTFPITVDTGSGGGGSTEGSCGVTYDGNGGVISDGKIAYVQIPYSGIITGWVIGAYESGSCTIKVFKDTYANFPPTTPTDDIFTTAPNLISQQKNQDLAPSFIGAGATVTIGDWIGFEINSVISITWLNLTLLITKS